MPIAHPRSVLQAHFWCRPKTVIPRPLLRGLSDAHSFFLRVRIPDRGDALLAIVAHAFDRKSRAHARISIDSPRRPKTEGLEGGEGQI